MASSRQRNLRKKTTLSFDDDEGEEQGAEEGSIGLPPAAKAAQAQREKKKAEKKALLSFGDDGGAEESGAAAVKPKGSRPKASLRAPSAAAETADERAQRVYTQMSGAGADAVVPSSASCALRLALHESSKPPGQPCCCLWLALLCCTQQERQQQQPGSQRRCPAHTSQPSLLPPARRRVHGREVEGAPEERTQPASQQQARRPRCFQACRQLQGDGTTQG